MRKEVDLDGSRVTLVGTAHVSEESRREVIETIDEVEPDLVAVELDQGRYESLSDRTGWKDLDLAEAIREGKGYVLFLNLLLSVYQRKIGLEEGSEPGMEMLEAVQKAEEKGLDYALIDRDISETFRRLREQMTLREKFRVIVDLFAGGEEYDIDELMEGNVMHELISRLETEYPSVSRVFLHERNCFMAEELKKLDFDRAVVVVGAAHLEGVAEELGREESSVEAPGKTIPWMKILNYALPVTILTLLGYSFYRLGFETGVQASGFWIVSNGLFALIGAVLARSHPLTWLVSFVSAPLTSLVPALGAGMVASYAEAKLRPPTVRELEDIPYITSVGSLWSNQSGRILLTFVLVTLGSAAATFLSLGFIASLIGL